MPLIEIDSGGVSSSNTGLTEIYKRRIIDQLEKLASYAILTVNKYLFDSC